MPPRTSILIIGWVASTLFVENLCSGGTQRRTSWSSPSKFDEACTCSQSGFSSDTPYPHCCFTQCQGLQLRRAEERARCDRRQSRCTSAPPAGLGFKYAVAVRTTVNAPPVCGQIP